MRLRQERTARVVDTAALEADAEVRGVEVEAAAVDSAAAVVEDAEDSVAVGCSSRIGRDVQPLLLGGLSLVSGHVAGSVRRIC